MSTPGVSRETWNSSDDATALIRHAAPLIPRQHLALVLAEIAASVWPLWQKAEPDDWQLGWCIAALRAWGLAEATLDELRGVATPEEEFDPNCEAYLAFVDEYGDAWMDYSDTELGENAVVAAAVTVLRSVSAVQDEHPVQAAVGAIEAAAFARAAVDDEAANREHEAWSEALDFEAKARSARDDRRPDEELSDEAHAALVEGWELEEAAFAKGRAACRKGLLASYETSAAIIRAAVPWRTTPATAWTIVKDLVLSGDAVLRLSSWTIVDAARREDLLTLEVERAVAFDEAQERSGLVLFQLPDGTGGEECPRVASSTSFVRGNRNW